MANQKSQNNIEQGPAKPQNQKNSKTFSQLKKKNLKEMLTKLEISSQKAKPFEHYTYTVN